MSPQTRSRSKPSADVSYRSTRAAPKQQVFPPRRRHVRTYGRSRPVRKDLKQSTLTQMNFVPSSMPEDHLELEEDEDEDIEEPVSPTPVQSRKRSRGTRRKTTGDEVIANEQPRDAKRRKTLGDANTSRPSSSFHTQTLTQFMSTNNHDWKIDDSEEDEDARTIIETPKKPEDNVALKDSKLSPGQQEGVKPPTTNPNQSVTPTNRRLVVPSSTSSTTPITTPAHPRYCPTPNESPLMEKSTNLNAKTPPVKAVSKKPKDEVVPDSCNTALDSPTTQTQTPAIKATPDSKAGSDTLEDKENITPGRSKPKLRKTPKRDPTRRPLKEIPNSDDDISDTEHDNDVFGIRGGNAPAEPLGDGNPSTDEPEAAETCYGVIGDETQAGLLLAEEANRELYDSDSTESTHVRSATPTPNPKKRQARHIVQAEGVAAIHSTSTMPSSPPPKGPVGKTPSKAETQVYTQYPESQRLPLEVVRALGPQTPNSDIMVSLHPEPLSKILNGTKNHEFRVWKIPPTVSRVWVYSTKPFSELKYMFVLGPPKAPGEIQDEEGVGNVEFNQGKTVAKFAYEILQVYELNNPVSLEDMKQKGWVGAAPQKYLWVRPAIVGELTANLKCALLGREEQDPGAALLPSSPDVTESQELDAQLRDEAEFSSQRRSTRASVGRTNQPRNNEDFTKPAVPTLQSGSSIQALPPPPSREGRDFVRPSQATTVSSPAVSPEKSLTRAITISSDPVTHLHSSPTAFRRARNSSLRSSQFQTRSQMLPDSLVNDEIRVPPPIVYDSADELSD